ncbi:helix-turn-helix domain-containing protein [Streptomyces spectabilis]|nr:helix-turn-helix transcriptional regulator [Streptomyces spectabilis]MBB5108912.1 DNA-binding CsgD family transcriptional regulator [Streptomyces spectabilis]MCI3899794.1 helix-turn-helix transcriptional regulator [Streptomyces spectabilis]
MVAHPGEPIAGLAALIGAEEAEVETALCTLSALALTQGDGEGFRALSPQVAMGMILARRKAELAAAQQKLEESRVAATRLIAECSDLIPAVDDPEFERLHDAREIQQRLAALASETVQEIMTFAPGGAHSAEDLAASREPNAALLGRGVRVRTVYVESGLKHQPTLDHIGWLHAQGAEVRTAAGLPIRMIVFDRRLAVLPVRMSDARAGAIVTRGEGFVAAGVALFEAVWATASPLAAGPGADASGLAAQEAEVLRLLANGFTDEAVGKRLGVSSRTARRITADLMERLGAASRFAAGVRAVQQGWLPAE